jgi:hypothetical protein
MPNSKILENSSSRYLLPFLRPSPLVIFGILPQILIYWRVTPHINSPS